MNRQRFNLTLAPRTIDTLREVGNASRYIDALVAQRARQWRRALRALRGRGWTLAAIGAALTADATTFGALGRHLSVLADEIAAGNDELERALDAPEAPAEARA